MKRLASMLTSHSHLHLHPPSQEGSIEAAEFTALVDDTPFLHPPSQEGSIEAFCEMPLAVRALATCTLLHRRARLKPRCCGLHRGRIHYLHPPSQEGSIEAARFATWAGWHPLPAPSFTGGLD